MIINKYFVKKGIALSMAFTLGATGIPTAGGVPAVRAYGASAPSSDGSDGTAAADGITEGSQDTQVSGSAEDTETLAAFDFDEGIGGWSYGAGWEYQYSAKDASSVEADNGQLRFNVDYSGDSDKDWSQATVVWESEDGKGLNLTGATGVCFDFLYDESKMTTGSFAVKLVEGGLDTSADIDLLGAQTVSGDIKKVPFQVSFDALGTDSADVQKLAIQLVGKNTDYKGALWIDHFRITKEKTPDTSVDSTIAVQSADTQDVRVVDKKLVTRTKDGGEQKTDLPSQIAIVDTKADAATKKVYAYLKAVGASDSVVYGHQSDVIEKAGSKELTNSDTKDVTGSIAGIFGLDTQDVLEKGMENVIEAANDATAQGAFITMSGHMPNFTLVPENPDYKDGDPVYAKYDFISAYTAPDASNDPMNQILPGGKYNKVYTAYLDMVAHFAKQVNGTILFRPFHENTGSWFWWGAAFCDAEIYKNVYRYTVEYLRDEKNVHNMLYVYGPSSNAASIKEYGLRYPGDAYVDIVGFDMYDNGPANDGVFMGQLKKQLQLVENFAKKHNKLVAVTETGPMNGSYALLKTGNNNKDWYNQALAVISDSDACYFMLWANRNKDGEFCTPYVDAVNENGTLHGHEMLDQFISFYNDGRSIFAQDQKEALFSDDFGKITAKDAVAGVKGYLTAPVAGQRILKAVTVRAKITGASGKTNVQFIAKTKKAKVTLNAAAKGKGIYAAKLTAKKLKTLGKQVGTLALKIDGKTVQKYSEIYNSKPPKEDPYLIDGFENYFGIDSQLTGSWATNADSDCKITLALTKDEKSEGDYGLQFTYDETANGWGGAVITKEVDWSDCNALQFYMVPDGKNQKTVIQIQASGVTYETYLNEYEAFQTNGTKPVRITIPFSEFCQRDTEGNPKGGLTEDCKQISTFGLWVNAVPDSAAVSDGRVSGTLYYDQITAVKSDVTEIMFQSVKH